MDEEQSGCRASHKDSVVVVEAAGVVDECFGIGSAVVGVVVGAWPAAGGTVVAVVSSFLVAAESVGVGAGRGRGRGFGGGSSSVLEERKAPWKEGREQRLRWERKERTLHKDR